MQQKNLSHTIVVLAGGISLDGKLPDYVYARLDRAIELFRSSQKNNIVLSGRYSFLFPKDKRPPRTEAAAMAAYLKQQGVKESDLLLEERSQDTISNAYYLKKDIFIPRNIRAATVITSTFHLPRVKYAFGKIFGPGYAFRYLGTPEFLSARKEGQVKRRQQLLLDEIRKLLHEMPTGDHNFLKGKFYKLRYYRYPRPAWVVDFVTQGK